MADQYRTPTGTPVITPMNDIGAFIRAVAKGEENAMEVSEHLLEDGSKVRVVALQNRKLHDEPPPAPERAESPRRAHIFHDLNGFADYLAKYKTGDTVVLADVASQAIAAVLDEKSALGFEVVTLAPAIHPLFVPWAALLAAGKTEIGAFAEFLLANRRVISFPDGDDLVLAFSQVRASVNTTIQRGIGNKSLNGVMITVEIAGEQKSQPVSLPNSITIRCPLFVGTSPLDIQIDLLLTGKSDGTVAVSCTSAGVLQAKVDAFLHMLGELTAIDGLIVGMGSPATRPWRYVGEEQDEE